MMKVIEYFLGFSRSTIVNGVLSWFLEHPDTTGISLTSVQFQQLYQRIFID